MAKTRVRSINPFHREDFLARIFHEMCEKELPHLRFPIGRSLSWTGFKIAATKADYAAVCVNALDFREPHIRPDRKLFTAFRLSLGTSLLQRNLPFNRPQLGILAESSVVQLKACNDAYPAERVSEILKAHTKSARPIGKPMQPSQA